MKNHREPVDHFRDVVEMNVYLKEWQVRLNLPDWVFYPVLGEKLDEKNVSQLDYTPTLKSGRLTIRRPMLPNPEGLIVKCPEEEALVHELLHAKIEYEDGEDFKTSMVGRHYHQAIEDLARALVAAKYGLPLSWFDNTKNDPELYPEAKKEGGMKNGKETI